MFTYNFVAGRIYYLCQSGWNGSTGTIKLNITNARKTAPVPVGPWTVLGVGLAWTP